MTSQRDQQNNEKKPKTGHKVLLAILVILLVLAAAAVIIYRSWVVKPPLPGGTGSGSSSGSDPQPTTVIDPETGEEIVTDENTGSSAAQRKSQDYYTILVVGTDTSSDSTDTIMLVSYDVTNQTAAVMSIPRDTLVDAYGNGRYTRINTIYSAYGRGEDGMDALTQEVSKLVGFVPDYRVFIKWELVGQMVDAIGGVEYDVPYHMEYDDPAQDLHIYIEKGLQTLNGDQAMQMVRWRKNNAGVPSGGGDGSDLTRLQVQQGFLKAVLKQTLQIKNVTKINSLAKLFGENIKGDLTVENLLWFGTRAIFGGLSTDSVEFVTMPWQAAGNYVYPDQDALLELINTKLNPYVTDVTLDQLDLIYFDANGNLCSTGTSEN